jgi:hypothetical protein
VQNTVHAVACLEGKERKSSSMVVQSDYTMYCNWNSYALFLHQFKYKHADVCITRSDFFSTWKIIVCGVISWNWMNKYCYWTLFQNDSHHIGWCHISSSVRWSHVQPSASVFFTGENTFFQPSSFMFLIPYIIFCLSAALEWIFSVSLVSKVFEMNWDPSDMCIALWFNFWDLKISSLKYFGCGHWVWKIWSSSILSSPLHSLWFLSSHPCMPC